MEDLFSTLLGLIPISLIIAIRLFAAMKKDRKAAPAPRRVEPLTKSAEEKSFRPHWEDSKEFSSPFPKVPQVRKEADKRRFQAARPNRGGAKPQKPNKAYGARAAVPAAAPSALFAPREKPDLGSLAQERPASNAAPGTQSKETQSGFPGNLARYTPLQRAVIMAEILGPPKGFD
jgi:hypothetical protein